MALFIGRLAAPQTAHLSQQRKLTTAAAILIMSDGFCEDEGPVHAQREPGNAEPAFVAQMSTHKPQRSHQAEEKKHAMKRLDNELEWNIQLGR